MRLFYFFALLALLLGGCASKKTLVSLEPLHVKTLSWEDLNHLSPPNEQFFEALKRTCKRVENLGPYCEVNSFEDLKKSFIPVKIASKGTMTGYYEPTLKGSKTRSERYNYPLYGVPKDLIQIELGEIYPELKNYRLRGRVVGNKVVAYPSHEAIDRGEIDAPVLVYVDSRVDAFFLHIQGSGKVILEEGGVLNLGYANQNGHPYRAIGRIMKERGYLSEVSMQTIRTFLYENPKKQDEILYTNPSYVFFESRNQGATGASGVQLIADASVAVDKRYIPLGMPLLIQTQNEFISPWVVAQDVGGAIKGEARLDYFFGGGEEAAKKAGQLYTPVEVLLILPRNF
jgi:membrane-bound lytic murein transglycosylase A